MERRIFLKSLAYTGGLVGTTGLLTSCKSSTAATDESFEQDESLVRAGAEFEAMGIKTYEVAYASGLLTDQAIIDTAVAYMGDHIAHLNELNTLLQLNSFETVDPTNADPDPGVGGVSNQTDVLEVALNVEFLAATFYFSGIVNQIKSEQARRVFANILPVETAHFVTFKNVLGFSPAIDGSLFQNLSSGLDAV
jgi:hypothetical protein